MLPQQYNPTLPPKTSCESFTLTLDPLRADGTAALKPDPDCGITAVTLREIEIHWQNTHHDVTIYRADNLCRSATSPWSPTQPLPPGAQLQRATFDILLENSDRPHTLSISPPHLIALEFPADIHRVLRWLDRRRFLLSACLAQKITALLLIVAAALAPAFDDDDADYDCDGDSNRYTRSV